MDQLSMPMRILLAVTLAFAALWFAALRPNAAAEEAPPPPAPAPAPAGNVAQPAPQAGTSDVRPAPAGAATTTKPAGAFAPTRPVRAVLRDIERRRTVVLLFSGAGPDDRTVRRVVGRIDRRGGKVAVHVAPIRRLGAYEPVVAGLPVQHAPTVLVIDRERRAQAITGLTVTRELDEAVRRALKR